MVQKENIVVEHKAVTKKTPEIIGVENYYKHPERKLEEIRGNLSAVGSRCVCVCVCR